MTPKLTRPPHHVPSCLPQHSSSRPKAKPEWRDPRISSLMLPVLALALTANPLRAQGCTQCRDNLAATQPATQRAYRHAIILMSGAAGSLFLATVFLLKRNP